MKPEEYLQIEGELGALIAGLQERIDDAMSKASKCPLPKNLRPATPKDIMEGAILWSDLKALGWDEESIKEGELRHWVIVDEVLRPNDEFKGFEGDDGCRYGYEGRFVEVTK